MKVVFPLCVCVALTVILVALLSALTQSTRSCWSLACRKNFLIPALMTNRRQRAAGTVRTRYPSNRKTLTDTASHIPLEAKGNGDLRLCGLRTAHHAALGPTHGPPSDPSPGSAVSLKRCSASEDEDRRRGQQRSAGGPDGTSGSGQPPATQPGWRQSTPAVPEGKRTSAEVDAKTASRRLVFIQQFTFLSSRRARLIYSHLKVQVSGFKPRQVSARVDSRSLRATDGTSGFTYALALL